MSFLQRHPYLTGSCLFAILSFVVFSIIEYKSSGNAIGIVDIEGEIIDVKNIVDQLQDFRNDDYVKGVLVRVDSPGGAVGSSQEVYSAIVKTRKYKPVYGSASNTAASGGYYILSATEKIFANPGTMTGSIGVIMQFPNLKKISDKLGITFETIKSGKYKDTGSMFRSASDADKEILEGMVNDVHGQFIDAILEQRKNLDRQQLIKVADGRILSGKQAYKIGLIDALGTSSDALNSLATDLGFGETYQVLYKEADNLLLEDLLGVFKSAKSLLSQKAPLPLKFLAY